MEDIRKGSARTGTEKSLIQLMVLWESSVSNRNMRNLDVEMVYRSVYFIGYQGI